MNKFVYFVALNVMRQIVNYKFFIFNCTTCSPLNSFSTQKKKLKSHDGDKFFKIISMLELCIFNLDQLEKKMCNKVLNFNTREMGRVFMIFKRFAYIVIDCELKFLLSKRIHVKYI